MCKINFCIFFQVFPWFKCHLVCFTLVYGNMRCFKHIFTIIKMLFSHFFFDQFSLTADVKLILFQIKKTVLTFRRLRKERSQVPCLSIGDTALKRGLTIPTCKVVQPWFHNVCMHKMQDIFLFISIWIAQNLCKYKCISHAYNHGKTSLTSTYCA